VLSRIAEALYWLGRYVERAEDTARILDVHYHLLLEEATVDAAEASAALLAVMGVPGPAAGLDDPDQALNALAYDRSSPSTIAGAIAAAWENGRSARPAISSEMWEVLNSMFVTLPSLLDENGAQTPHALFGWVKDRSAVLAGLSESTMSHDDGWRFLVLGRSLERVDMTCRLLTARSIGVWGDQGWVTTLRCCSAHEAYLRTYQRAVDASLAGEFLLRDRLFPRSVFCALTTAERCLAELDPSEGRAGLVDPARLTLGQARATLEFSSLTSLLESLPERLASLQMRSGEAAAAVASRYFRHTRAVEWSA
jgi:uncharacterized alpha-E superfamily protein